mmetsp:Transcript_19748/g.78656  ORF Transcript_19748/g.78656 Transcript_19748/m.78656 type:complete len:118 (-) Transcript_19748:774-1127(-)
MASTHPVARAFAAMLEQKVAVLGVPGVAAHYTSVCPMVGGSVGQHMRHSLDHCARAADAVEALLETPAAARRDAPLLQYDVRQRGTGAEVDVAVAATEARRARADAASTEAERVALC